MQEPISLFIIIYLDISLFIIIYNDNIDQELNIEPKHIDINHDS